MELLKKYILEQGEIISDEALKVDSFINHQIDGNLMFEIGKELKRKFENENITKILTVEASGIAIGVMAAYSFGVPLVFAKKKKPKTVKGDILVKKVYSFTKDIYYDVSISKEFINEGDRILIVDDFLAHGNAALALSEMIEEAGAVTCGIGIVIEKGFQNGGRLIREKGIKLESLAIVDKFTDGKIKFI